MEENKFVIKFISMNFEEKKVEIMRLLKDLVEHSTRAKKLYSIIPNMEENEENTEELIINYSDIISAIDKVDADKAEEEKQQTEYEAKKIEKNRKIISQKLKNEEKESQDDLEDLFKDIA